MGEMIAREVPVASIRVGARFRKDMGDLADLARSIDEQGLLCPIAIDADNRLLVGERRLRAVRDVLRWETIHAFVFDMDPLQAEHDENECRKQFTTSERVAIARALRERIGNRQGQRTDLGEGELPGKSPEVKPGQETRDAVARAAGFSSADTLRRAEKVVEQGTPELVEAMDAGEIRPAAAARVADLSEEAQQQVVEQVRAGKKPKEAIAEARAEPSLLDGNGVPVRPGLLAAWKLAHERSAELRRLLKRAAELVHELAEGEGGAWYRLAITRKVKKVREGEAVRYCSPGVERAMAEIRNGIPWTTVCPYCELAHPGETDPGCRGCKGLGWGPESLYARANQEAQEAADRLREVERV